MSTATDERVDLGVDLDAEVPCECFEECRQAATWRLIATPCRHSSLLCEGHLIETVRYISEQRSMGRGMACSVGGPQHFVPKYETVPL